MSGPVISWNGESSKTAVKTKDSSWCDQHVHRTQKGDCVFRFKIGNKLYALSNGDNEKRQIGEAGLYRKYRYGYSTMAIAERPWPHFFPSHYVDFAFSSLFPFGRHYCAIHFTDGTKSYRPESQIVIDPSSCFAFFSADPASTLRTVAKELEELSTAWNADNKDKVLIASPPTFSAFSSR